MRRVWTLKKPGSHSLQTPFSQDEQFLGHSVEQSNLFKSWYTELEDCTLPCFSTCWNGFFDIFVSVVTYRVSECTNLVFRVSPLPPWERGCACTDEKYYFLSILSDFNSPIPIRICRSSMYIVYQTIPSFLNLYTMSLWSRVPTKK